MAQCWKKLLILILPAVASCRTAAPVQPVKVTPPVSAPVQHQVDPVMTPLPIDLAQAEEPLETDSDPEAAALDQADGAAATGPRAAIDDLENADAPPAANPNLKAAVEDELQRAAHDLPIEINDRVLGFVEYYQNGRGRASIEAGLRRMGRYQPMIEKVLQEEGVPLDLIYLCQAESAFEPEAVSRAAAKGMWQFISSRGKEYGLRQNWWIDERSDPEKSTRAAARHLKDLYQQFGDWYLAMAAYNSGPVRVQRAMESTGAKDFWALADKRALPKETINYVPNIIALTIIGKNPAKYGIDITPDSPLDTERVKIAKETDLRVIAEAIDVPVQQLRDLNSEILHWTTPPDDPDFQLVLPSGYAEAFDQKVTTLPDNKRILFREYLVRKGDTPGAIARKYRISLAELTRANKLAARPVLHVGQLLVIPVSGRPPAAETASVATAVVKKAPSVRSAAMVSRPSSYTVRRGDTLSEIAGRFHTTVARLKTWNHLKTARLTVGEKLIVQSQPVQTASASQPKKVVHRVKQGETLDQIATTYNTSVDDIISWNESEDLSIIHPGDRITIFLGSDN